MERDEILDMRALCEVCGKDMWPCRSDKKFCSDKCRQIDRVRVEAEATREALSKKKCVTCGGPIPLDKRIDTLYCSEECKPPHLLAETQFCDWCGSMFRPRKKGQRTCSLSCRSKLLRRSEGCQSTEKECVVCGTAFTAKSPKQETCSRSCGQKLRIMRQPAAKKVQTKACAFCGTSFAPKYASQETCSRACSAKLRMQRNPGSMPRRGDFNEIDNI